jgi:hypothetical protein
MIGEILLFAMCIVLCILVYLLYRNNKVSMFRSDIIELVYRSDNWIELHKLYDKYDYDEMVFSIKPLKLSSWYTKEEIEMFNE